MFTRLDETDKFSMAPIVDIEIPRRQRRHRVQHAERTERGDMHVQHAGSTFGDGARDRAVIVYEQAVIARRCGLVERDIAEDRCTRQRRAVDMDVIVAGTQDHVADDGALIFKIDVRRVCGQIERDMRLAAVLQRRGRWLRWRRYW